MARTTTKKQFASAVKAGEVLATAGTLSLDGVTTKLSGTSLEIQKSLADIATKMTARVTEFESLGKAVELKQQELKSLYQVEAAATTLDDLQNKIASLEEEYKKLDVARQLQWQRSEEEYKYARQRLIQKEADDHKRSLDLKEQEWKAREATLAAKEQEFLRLQKEVADFPQKMAATVKETEVRITNLLNAQGETRLTLLKKDYESQIAILRAKEEVLLSQIENLYQDIVSLNQQVKDANTNAMTVAAKALDSASKAQTAEALQKVLESAPAGKQSK